MISRMIEDTIIDATKHFPIILLTGPRQIGKSTLLYNSFLDRGYSYISLDNLLDLNLALNDPKTFLELERIVNESRLKKGNLESNGMYILSGSQKKNY